MDYIHTSVDMQQCARNSSNISHQQCIDLQQLNDQDNSNSSRLPAAGCLQQEQRQERLRCAASPTAHGRHRKHSIHHCTTP
jgi:hypothetical protein